MFYLKTKITSAKQVLVFEVLTVRVFHEQENEFIQYHLTKFAALISNLNLYRSNLGFWHYRCGALPAGNSHSSPRLDVLCLHGSNDKY